MLSDTIVTIRNDRYVRPVKHEYRSAIGGIVHDQSSSEQTLFMEPRAIIDLNNQLQQAILNEKQEIERILKNLTSEIAEHEETLLVNLETIAMVDFIFARARLAVKMKAAKPTLNEKGIIDMKQARSEEHTSELQSRFDLVCRLLLEKKNATGNHVRKP